MQQTDIMSKSCPPTNNAKPISFGIFTTFYLRTQPAPSSVVTWRYNFPNQLVSASTTASSFLHTQDFAQNASVVNKNIGFSVSSNGLSITVIGAYSSSQSNFADKVNLGANGDQSCMHLADLQSHRLLRSSSVASLHSSPLLSQCSTESPP